jgi:hypothetical protein
MTVERTGLAAGVPAEASTLEAEIFTALMRVRRSTDRHAGHEYGEQLVAAILGAVSGSEMLQRHLADQDVDIAEMVRDAAAAIATQLSEMERPTSRLEDDILNRLRAVPTAKALAARYGDARDAERVRRRGLIRAMLDAASNNAFVFKPSDEIIIDLDDPDFDLRSDFSVAQQDFLLDCERMDAGLKAIHCMVEADQAQNDLTPPTTQRDALIWAMVAIDTGSGHPTHKTQVTRIALAAKYTDCKASSLKEYLKELRKGRRPQEGAKFSDAEHQLFQDRSALVRKIATYRGAGWDLVLPALRGWAMAALPKPASKNRVQKPRKVTSAV